MICWKIVKLLNKIVSYSYSLKKKDSPFFTQKTIFLFIDKNFRLKRGFQAMLHYILFLLLLFYPLTLLFVMYYKAKQKPKNNADYLIVLGARVIGTRLSQSLLRRAEVALHYLKENETTKIIVSGGQGVDEDISEAEALKRYFLKNGIKKERILIENQSTTTLENLTFSKKLLPNDQVFVVIVTSDFHTFRSYYYARLLQFQHVETLSAPTPKHVRKKMIIRELFAITAMFFKDYDV